MLIQILKCVWNDDLARTLAPGEVVTVDEEQGAGYLTAGYAVPVVLDEEEAS